MQLFRAKAHYVPRLRGKGGIFSCNGAIYPLQSQTELSWFSLFCAESIVLWREDGVWAGNRLSTVVYVGFLLFVLYDTTKSPSHIVIDPIRLTFPG